MGVEEQDLFQLLEVENVTLIQQKDGCNFTRNASIMPRPERCQSRHESRNESLDDDAVETSQNHKSIEEKQ